MGWYIRDDESQTSHEDISTQYSPVRQRIKHLLWRNWFCNCKNESGIIKCKQMVCCFYSKKIVYSLLLRISKSGIIKCKQMVCCFYSKKIVYSLLLRISMRMQKKNNSE